MYRTRDVIKSELLHYKMILWYLNKTSVPEIIKTITRLEEELKEAPE